MFKKLAWMIWLGCLSYASIAIAGSGPYSSFYEAQKAWTTLHKTPNYKAYYQSFLRKNESLRLEKLGNCYNIPNPSHHPIQMMLVITHEENQDSGMITQALPNIDSARADCFIDSYVGVKMPIPPITPYVLFFQFAP